MPSENFPVRLRATAWRPTSSSTSSTLDWLIALLAASAAR